MLVSADGQLKNLLGNAPSWQRRDAEVGSCCLRGDWEVARHELQVCVFLLRLEHDKDNEIHAVHVVIQPVSHRVQSNFSGCCEWEAEDASGDAVEGN